MYQIWWACSSTRPKAHIYFMSEEIRNRTHKLNKKLSPPNGNSDRMKNVCVFCMHKGHAMIVVTINEAPTCLSNIEQREKWCIYELAMWLWFTAVCMPEQPKTEDKTRQPNLTLYTLHTFFDTVLRQNIQKNTWWTCARFVRVFFFLLLALCCMLRTMHTWIHSGSPCYLANMHYGMNWPEKKTDERHTHTHKHTHTHSHSHIHTLKVGQILRANIFADHNFSSLNGMWPVCLLVRSAIHSVFVSIYSYAWMGYMIHIVPYAMYCIHME